MIPVAERVEQYLVQRDAFGTGLSASPVRELRRFAVFADEGAGHVTTELFLRWKLQRRGAASRQSWSYRLSHVRTFARWLQSLEPWTEVPPQGLIPRNRRRPQPYIYTDEEVAGIVASAARLPSRHGLRGTTCAALFGLLAVTGLRIGEALALDDGDVNTNEAALHVRHAKNGRNRTVPITPCTAERLACYRSLRDRTLWASDTPAFFRGERGQRIRRASAEHDFARVGQEIGLRERQPSGHRGTGPRLHDLRHTMAVRTLVDWFRSGLDPDREMYKLSAWLGHGSPGETYWYLEAVPELLHLATERAERAVAAGGGVMTVRDIRASLPAHVQRFFADWLIAQREASPHTVASYRDTFRLLLAYASRQLGRQPTDLSVTDIDADLVAGFLAFVEDGRNNGVRTRNVRRAAIRGFFRFVAIREPALLLHCQRVLAIPAKRETKRTVDFLERAEAAALLAMPDLSTWIGRRDRNLLLVALQTGLRVSELIGLNVGDVVLGPSRQPHVRCRGKGRKERATPLRGDCAKALAESLPERAGAAREPLFASNRNGRFSRDGIERIVRKYTRLASAACPSLAGKRVSPHTLRHYCCHDSGTNFSPSLQFSTNQTLSISPHTSMSA